LYAAHSNCLKPGAAWYGQLEGLKKEARTRTAPEVAPDVKAPVIIDQVEKMQDAWAHMLEWFRKHAVA